jgi:putative transposase
MLNVVKNNLDQRAAERSYGLSEAELTPAQGWSLPKLRQTWNHTKSDVAPWWAANSKEAYNSGLDGLARALERWSKSRHGEHSGTTVGFPGSSPSIVRRDRCGSRPVPSTSRRTTTTLCFRG